MRAFMYVCGTSRTLMLRLCLSMYMIYVFKRTSCIYSSHVTCFQKNILHLQVHVICFPLCFFKMLLKYVYDAYMIMLLLYVYALTWYDMTLCLCSHMIWYDFMFMLSHVMLWFAKWTCYHSMFMHDSWFLWVGKELTKPMGL